MKLGSVGITYNLKKDFPGDRNPGSHPPDLAAECEEESTVERLAMALSRIADQVVLLPHTSDLLQRLEDTRPDLVFNIAEGWTGRNRESLIPALLELLAIPYTGSDALSLGIALDKAVAKRVVTTSGIPTPLWFKACSRHDIEDLGMMYPLFVKPVFEGSSKGIRGLSKVSNQAELAERVEWIVAEYAQPALIEDFLPGREFTVGILGNGQPHVLPIMEVCPGNRESADADFVYCFETKSGNLERFKIPAPIPESLANELRSIALGVFEALECRDVARVDIRLDAEGKPNFLEVNPLPGLSSVSLLPLQAQAAGLSFDDLVERIAASAMRRYGLA